MKLSFHHKNLFLFLILLFVFSYCAASDLEMEFNKNEARSKKIKTSNALIIKDSEKIICGLHNDWGNELYRKGDNLFKADPMSEFLEIKRVAVLKNGKFEWKDRRMFNYEIINLPWVMKSLANGKYEAYVKFPVVGVMKAECDTFDVD